MIELNGVVQVFLGGSLGSVLLELIKIISWQDKKKLDEAYTRVIYWVATIGLFVLSGIVAVLNGIDHVKLLSAVQLGVNAPAIVAGYASAASKRKKHSGAANALASANRSKGLLSLLAW